MALESKDSQELAFSGQLESLRSDTGVFAPHVANEQRTNGTGYGRQPAADRGLPEPDNLNKLARVWLETQRELWPELVSSGLLPAPTDEVVEGLADEFRQGFLADRVAPVELATDAGPWEALAASYVRYSDDNSNPRSLDDQLVLQLRRARQESRFIPWAYVFADSSITATHGARRGYQMSKRLLAITGPGEVETLYIDELGRASRDSIESLRLGRQVDGLRKRIVGVSDGFDSGQPQSRMQIHVYGMMNEWFITQLRSKVSRGMGGAFRRGTAIGKPAFGYKLVPLTDAGGNPVTDQDGKVIRTYAVDDDHVDEVVRSSSGLPTRDGRRTGLPGT
ncbi:MAG: recombinase family protein [Phycisphaeraceae bacterium]